jgi:hypothetical protein
MMMLFAAPLLPAIGWRNFWLANALAASACAALLAIYAPAMSAASEPAGRFFAEVKTVVAGMPRRSSWRRQPCSGSLPHLYSAASSSSTSTEDAVSKPEQACPKRRTG